MSGHDHDHSKTFQPDHAEPVTRDARVGLALRELLIGAGHYSAEEELAMIARMSGASGLSPAHGWTPLSIKD
jgi:hypothetical protein